MRPVRPAAHAGAASPLALIAPVPAGSANLGAPAGAGIVVAFVVDDDIVIDEDDDDVGVIATAPVALLILEEESARRVPRHAFVL